MTYLPTRWCTGKLLVVPEYILHRFYRFLLHVREDMGVSV
jgi:hypothetical protein